MTVHIEAASRSPAAAGGDSPTGGGGGHLADPPTPVETLDGCLDLCDLVLVMSVMPGFGGQAFEPVALEKLRRLRARSVRACCCGRRRLEPPRLSACCPKPAPICL